MNNFAIMFHHFHDENKHLPSQGSINNKTFRQMINFLQAEYDILNADIWYEKALNNKLKPNQICLTFDDALACQYDIAYPVLQELGVCAFWFVYTSIYTGVFEKIEIYRHFRTKNFTSIERFYDSFFQTVISCQDKLGVDVEKELKKFSPQKYLQQFIFYTDDDKKFRYTRDCLLGEEKYNAIMDNMIKSSDYDIETSKKLLWITEEQLFNLAKNNHIIGLHSHNHPTNMAAKTYQEQMEEYKENKSVLEKILRKKIDTVSYPCNSYNNDTDEIMDKQGIKLGFDAFIHDTPTNHLHFSRKDHAYVLKEMSK